MPAGRILDWCVANVRDEVGVAVTCGRALDLLDADDDVAACYSLGRVGGAAGVGTTTDEVLTARGRAPGAPARTLGLGPSADAQAADVVENTDGAARRDHRGRVRLPPFEVLRSKAYGLLGEAADWLRSDHSDPLLTPQQAEGRLEALRLIGEAKDALNRAAP